MISFFWPDSTKLVTTGILAGMLLASFTLRMIPVQIDILDLRELPQLVLFCLARIPIELFDSATGGAFAPWGEGFLVFPTLPQVGFAILFDVALLYSAACAICHTRRRPK